MVSDSEGKPDDDSSFGVWPSNGVIVGVIVASIFISVSVPFLLWYTGNITDDMVNIFDIFGSLAGILLTMALLLVYWRISSLQDSQNDIHSSQMEILDKQTTLEKAIHKAEVDWDEPSDIGEDYLDIHLYNKGNGIARKLSLDVDWFVAENSKGDLEYLADKRFEIETGTDNIPSPPVRIGYEPTKIPLKRKDRQQRRRVGGILEAGEDDGFRGTFEALKVNDGEKHRISFEEFTTGLNKFDISILGFKIYLKYENILSEESEHILFTGWRDLEQDMSLNELLKSHQDTSIGEHRGRIVNMRIPPEMQ